MSKTMKILIMTGMTIILLTTITEAKILSVTCGEDNMKCNKYNTNDNTMNISKGDVHLHFRIKLDAPQNITIRVLTAPLDTTNDIYTQKDVTLKYTCDGWNFKETTQTETIKPNNDRVFRFNPGCTNVRVSTFIPMTYTWFTNMMEATNTSQYVDLTYEKLQSGRKMPIVEVTNFANNTKKHCAVIVARQHAGEAYSQWNLYGLLNNIKYAPKKSFLNSVDLLIFPMANPDGQFTGNENNAQNVDLNDAWDSNKSQEIEIMKKKILEFNQTCGGIELFIDMHSANAYQRNTSFIHFEKTHNYTAFYEAMKTYTTYKKLDLKDSEPGQSRYWAKNTFKNALTVTTENVQSNPTYNRQALSDDGANIIKALQTYWKT